MWTPGFSFLPPWGGDLGYSLGPDPIFRTWRDEGDVLKGEKLLEGHFQLGQA